MKETLIIEINKALKSLGIEPVSVIVDYPTESANGDFYTNVAMACAKSAGRNPLDLALQISEKLKEQKIENVTDIQIAKPGFINFNVAEKYFDEQIAGALEQGKDYGKNKTAENKKIIVEYTDPNPFKLFHVGHIMQNAIGESISRLIEWSGSDIRRFCYQGDVGRHVALTIYGLRFMDAKFPADDASLRDKVRFLGQSYAKGATHFKNNPEVEPEVQLINKKIYEKSDPEMNEIYEKGREWSLEYFEEIYKILGTKFDRYFFESESSAPGISAVMGGVENGIFEKSDGAIIFNGEKYGLHTDVLITKQGLPTYAAKEIGLAEIKYDAFPYDLGITITANEQNDFFKLTIKANEILFPFLQGKLKHISHGMIRLPEGKMSSRTGDVVDGRDFIEMMEKSVLEKMNERDGERGADTAKNDNNVRAISESDKKEIAEIVAVSAIKFSILKSTIGKDIIFDKTKALSLEGDSGPYVQYSAVRAQSVLKKAEKTEIQTPTEPISITPSESHLKRLIARFPYIVTRSQNENAPHHIAQFLVELAAAFNGFYASSPISKSPARVDLTRAFYHVVENGLWLLGIRLPKEM
jgi:arginyl-tRNA synthetase